MRDLVFLSFCIPLTCKFMGLPKLDVTLLNEAGNVGEFELEHDIQYVVRPFPDLQAWEIDRSQQAKDEITGRWVQTVSDRSKKPIRVFRNSANNASRETDTIAGQKWDEALAFRDSVKQKNSLSIWFAIIAVVMLLIISIIALVNLKGGQGAEAAAVMLAPLVFKIKRKFKKQEHHEAVENKESIEDLKKRSTDLVDCLIYVESTHERLHREVTKNLLPPESLERDYADGNPIHLIGLDEKGFWAIEPEPSEDGESPQDLMIVLEKFDKLIAKAFPMGGNLLEKIKMGFLIAFCFSELIILFLIVMTLLGG